MGIRCALQTGADGDAVDGLQDHGRIGTVHAVDIKGDGGSSGTRQGTVDDDARNRGEAIDQMLEHLLLFVIDVAHRALQNVAGAGGQTRDAHGVLGACFIVVGQMLRLEPDFREYTGAAGTQGSWRNSAGNIQCSGAGGAQQRLMSREGQQINVHFHNIDGNGAGGLGCIHHKGDAALPADFTDLFNGIQGAGYI